MRLLSSLQNRVFVATALLAVIPIGVALHFVSIRVAREGEEQLRRSLVEAANLVERHHQERQETLTVMARLVADLPKLGAAVDTRHPPTVAPVARDYRGRVKAGPAASSWRSEPRRGRRASRRWRPHWPGARPWATTSMRAACSRS